MKWAVLGLLLFFSPAETKAAEIDVDAPFDNIFEACRHIRATYSSENLQPAYDDGVCRGFIFGWMSLAHRASVNYCQANGVKLSDVALIFNAFVVKNPVWRTRQPIDALSAAMVDAFPCPTK